MEQIETKNIDYDFVKTLAKKINKIKDKQLLILIVNIITTLNPNISITEKNGSGLFIKFNELVPETYTRLEKFLYKNIAKKNIDSDIITTSEYIPYSPDELSSHFEKYKLSNKEKTLIKKQRYSSIINS